MPQSPLAKAVVMTEIASSFLYAVFIFSVVAGLLRRNEAGSGRGNDRSGRAPG